jgi:hypothetical protein
MLCKNCNNYSLFNGFCNLHKRSISTTETCKQFVLFGNQQLQQKTYKDHTLIRALCDIEEVRGYTHFYGTVSIYNSTLCDLRGLESMIFINEDLEILANDGLRSLKGLENLTTIIGNLVIRNNKNLSLDEIEKFIKRVTIGKNTWF